MVRGIAGNSKATPLTWPGVGVIGQQAGKDPRGRPSSCGGQTPHPPLHTLQLTLASGPDLGEAEAAFCSHMWEGYEKKNPCWPKHLNKNYTRMFCSHSDMVRINLEIQKRIILLLLLLLGF